MANLIPFNRKKNDLLSSSFTDMQSMLDDFFSEGLPFRRSLVGDTFKIDVQENDQSYVVEAEMPGVDKRDVSVDLEDGRLRISVNHEENVDDQKKNYIHRERRYAMMQRTIALADADASGIKGKLENGVLTITIPKKEKLDTSIKVAIE
jgi:HSP20 family protein